MDETHDWYSPETATFGDRVAGARGAAGMTQQQLAKRLGIRLATLRSWENDLSEPLCKLLLRHSRGITRTCDPIPECCRLWAIPIVCFVHCLSPAPSNSLLAVKPPPMTIQTNQPKVPRLS